MVELIAIRKTFGPVAALDDISLEVRPGEIHGLLGENGAGKSTLMRVLFGMLRPDAGMIRVDGRAVALRRPDDARQLGIAMVHQHFMLIEQMTVAENVMLGDRTGGRFCSPATLQRDVAAAAARLGIEVDPASLVADLSVGQRQRVELLRVLRHPVRTLILDEPTTVLAPAEIEPLFALLRALHAGGCGVVFISHKLNEVVRLCDRVTVLRRGRVVAAARVADTTADALAQSMISERDDSAKAGGMAALGGMGLRPVPSAGNIKHNAPIAPLESMPLRADPLLLLQSASTDPQFRAAAITDIDLALHPGEIVGIAGVEGNGQAALVEACLGLLPIARGRLEIRARRIAHLADDRHREALALPLTIAENSVLKSHSQPPFSRRGRLRWPAIRSHARRLIQDYDIRTHSTEAAASELSGGNQQKLVVARELAGEPDLIIAANPTRGLDWSASANVHAALHAAAARDAAVLLVSPDLDEVLKLSHRVGVLFRGRLTMLPPGDDLLTRIARLMSGAAA